MSSRTRIKGTSVEEGRGEEALWNSLCHCQASEASLGSGKPTTGQDHCFMGPSFFFVNVNQLAQEIGGVYVVVDRGLKYTGIY